MYLVSFCMLHFYREQSSWHQERSCAQKISKGNQIHQVDIQAKILQFPMTLIIQFIKGKQMFYYPGEESEVAKY